VRLEALLEHGGLVLGQAQLLAPAGAVLLVAARAAGARALDLPLVVVAVAAGERGGAVGRRGRPRRRLLLPHVSHCTTTYVSIYSPLAGARFGNESIDHLELASTRTDGAERGGPGREVAAGGGGRGQAALRGEPAEAEAEIQQALLRRHLSTTQVTTTRCK
jgi:hypothetical protein